MRFAFLLCGCQIEPLTAVGKISHDNVIDIVLINFDVDEASGVEGGGGIKRPFFPTASAAAAATYSLHLI